MTDLAEEGIPIPYDKIAYETDRAWLLDLGGDEKVWLPKSHCELEKAEDDTNYALVPEWLAVEKGLI